MSKNKEFEVSLKKLEELVDEIKKPNISLDDAIGNYEKGIEYYERCKSILDEANQKITVMKEKVNE